MGPLGWQETIAIFVIALLLFGPKKLPQLGKDIAKMMGEFRRATSDLKGTWDREMAAADRETGLTETARQIDRELTAASVDETYHSASSTYDSGYDYGHGAEYSEALSASANIPEGTLAHDATGGPETTLSTEGATATQGAETTVAELIPPPESAEPASIAPPQVAETIARSKRALVADEDGAA